MKKFGVVFFLLASLACSVHAANVRRWYDDGLSEKYTYTTPDYEGLGVTIYMEPTAQLIDMFLSWEEYLGTDNYLHYLLTFDGTKSSNVPQNIIAAELGDVAGFDTLRNLNEAQCLIHNRIDDGVPSQQSTTIDIIRNGYHYLAFACGTNTDVIYGWVMYEIIGRDSFMVWDYAYDLDGGPMIVGGGAYSIPEPSGGLLLVLGAAALGLRRRRVSPPYRGGVRFQAAAASAPDLSQSTPKTRISSVSRWR